VASRDSIRELQPVLSSKGLYDGRIDGLNGPKTERAILLYEAELHRDGSNAADKSQLNELRGKVDALAKALTDMGSEAHPQAGFSRFRQRQGSPTTLHGIHDPLDQ
jgi:peptidoglycan hydrolase-like protein with peptidoglycan-binding domain